MYRPTKNIEFIHIRNLRYVHVSMYFYEYSEISAMNIILINSTTQEKHTSKKYNLTYPKYNEIEKNYPSCYLLKISDL